MKKKVEKGISVVLGICLLIALSYLSGCQGKITAEYQGFYPDENGPKNNIHKSRTWSVGNYGRGSK